MKVLSIPRVIVSGASTGVGKTLLSIGLSLVYRTQGLSVSCCLNGSSLAQSSLFSHLTRRFARTLDSRLLSSEQILLALHQASVGTDLVIIDGRAGLYDGDAPGSLHGSDAELSHLTGTPLVLVVDGDQFSTSLAALIRGYSTSFKEIAVAGVIVNRVDTSADGKDRLFFDAAMELFGLSKVWGAVPQRLEPYPIPETFMGERNQPHTIPRQFYVDLTQLIRSCVATDDILHAARSAPPVQLPVTEGAPSNRRCRIAVSDDPCFCLTYRDNFDLLRFYGAEIVPFSPLADANLPQRIGGLYVTGGLLQEYAASIAGNTSLHASIRAFVEKGGVVYSEGAGTAYLASTFQMSGSPVSYTGVGLIGGDAHLAAVGEAAAQFYSGLLVEPTVLADRGAMFKTLSSGGWSFLNAPSAVEQIEFLTSSGSTFLEGYSVNGRHLSTFTFPHWGTNPEFARNFVEYAASVKV